MKKLTSLVALTLVSGLAVTACSFNSERQKAAAEKIQGNTQEAVGNVTGNKELQAKGKANRTKGNLRSTKEDIKDTVTGQ